MSAQFSKFIIVPTGALTSKPYAFTARSWELSNISSLDIFDSFNSNISISVRGSRPLRVLPKLNELLNEEWITDKIRLSYEGCSRQRLVSPMVRTENTLVPCSWLIAFQTFSKILNEVTSLSFLSGRLLDLESLVALKDFSSSLGSECRFNSSGLLIPNDLRDFYLCLSDISTFETFDLLIIVGCDLKIENPLLNLRIRKLVRQGFLKVEFFGLPSINHLNSSSFGTSTYDFTLFLEGRSLLSIKYALSKNPFILIGYSFLKFFYNLPFFLMLNYRFSIIHPFSGYLNSCEVGFSSPSFLFTNYKSSGNKRLLFLVGVDEVKKVSVSDYVVYQGHNGFAGANLANLIFPSPSFFEKNVSYINNFGLQQQTEIAVGSPINIRNDIKIFESLLIFLY